MSDDATVTTRPSIVATLVEAQLLELVPALAHRLLRTPATAIFGYDYFVSYARRDASRYAERLYEELESRGYVTCFDRTDLHAGEPLPDALARACARSRCTVLVDTIGARQSQYVADEIGRVERKGRKGRLIRIMAPRLLPLGFTSTPEPDRTWTHLPAASQALLANAIGLDDPVDANGLESGTVSAALVDGIVKHRRRVRTLRRFTGVAAAVVAVFAYFVGALAWQRSITSAARGLSASAASVNTDLAALYGRARSLADQAVTAGVVPLALSPEAEAEVQNALRAVLRVTAAPQGESIPLANDTEPRRVLLADAGRLVAWRGPDSSILLKPTSPRSPARAIVPGPAGSSADPVLDWTITLNGSAAQAIVARRDRLETWATPGDGAAPGNGAASTTCRPAGIAWQRVMLSGTIALVAGTDAVGVVNVPACAVLWQRRLDEFGGTSVATVQMAASDTGASIVAFDTGNGVHVLDASSARSIQRASHANAIGRWHVSGSGTHLAAAVSDSYFTLASGPSSSLDDALPYSHPQGPIIGLVFSPDGAFVVSSTAADIRIWDTSSTSLPTGPAPARELTMPWAPAGFAFAGARAALFAMPPLGARVRSELQPLQVPDGLEFTPVPLSIDRIAGIHAQGATVAVEGPDTLQLVELAPAAVWAEAVEGGDLPDQVEATSLGTASMLPGGDIEVSLPAGQASGASTWRRSAGRDADAWRESPAAAAGDKAGGPRLPDAASADCRVRTGDAYAVMVCPERVRLYRRSGRGWSRHADLLCVVPSAGCQPPVHPVRIQDVRLDERGDRLVALHVAGRRYFTVTYPLSTRGLRDAVASIDDALVR
jgi:hypothetical protein